MDSLQSINAGSLTTDPQGSGNVSGIQSGLSSQTTNSGQTDLTRIPGAVGLKVYPNCVSQCTQGVSNTAVSIKQKNLNIDSIGLGLFLVGAVIVGIFAHKVLSS